MNTKALVLFSGGIDSTTCLAEVIYNYGRDNVIALSMYYGQRHVKELEAARNIAGHYRVELIQLGLAGIFDYSDCALLGGSPFDIPTGSYQDQLKETEIVSTYVPFRNGLFLSVAASIAISKNCGYIFYGAHADDAATKGGAYPDCTEEFNLAMKNAIQLGSGGQVNILAPFIDWTKSDIIARGLQLKVPYELTWSCYQGDVRPCGVCGTCIDRAEAFRKNGVKDPA